MDKYCICWRRKNSSKDALPLIFNHPNSRQEAMMKGDDGEVELWDKKIPCNLLKRDVIRKISI
jgi:hypothetical protein